ncbi:MAG: hypothetical protein D6805_04485 [Planctomycetota bacterium]|nr:MAG: hypothetical protein D6805_04485 [Planctomycetota bacterium]
MAFRGYFFGKKGGLKHSWTIMSLDSSRGILSNRGKSASANGGKFYRRSFQVFFMMISIQLGGAGERYFGKGEDIFKRGGG